MKADSQSRKPALKRHEQIVNELSRRIFSGEMQPGDKLPTEKELSAQFNVNRTTLRTALKQLEAMHVILIRHGDGMYVEDYVRNAGLDFLQRLFQVDDASIDIDLYLIDEIWEFWIFYLPSAVQRAVEKCSQRQVRMLMQVCDEQRNAVNDKARYIELDLKSQDVMADMLDNRVYLMLHNSSRPLRRKILSILYDIESADERQAMIEGKISLYEQLFTGMPEERHSLIEVLREALNVFRQRMKESLRQHPELLEK